MTTPNVTVQKKDGNTGVVPPSPDGVLAIIAPSSSGTKNQPAMHTSDRNALAEFGHGPLVEDASIVMSLAGKPVVLIRPDVTTEGAYGTITVTGAAEEGAAAITSGETKPYDDYEAVVEFKKSGTVGVAGITYRESLDDGRTWSGEKALGTLTTLTIPDSGVSFDLENGGAIVAGQKISCPVTGPRMDNDDLVAALEALRTTKLRWEAVLVHGEATSTTVGTLGTWLAARNAKGVFRTGLMNTRMKNAGESESAYATAMATATASMSSIDVVVGADGARIASPLRGFVLKRPTALIVAARGMAIDIAEEPAYVALGPLLGVTVTDDNGNPRDHDEEMFPGLDELRLTTLRTIEGETGVYVNNSRLISPSGSDFVYWPHARVMNAGCERLHAVMRKQLSKGVAKDPATGKILETEASALEASAQESVEARLKNRVSGLKATVSRDDDLSSNEGAMLTGELAISALAYVKGIAFVAKFVRRITASAT